MTGITLTESQEKQYEMLLKSHGVDIANNYLTLIKHPDYSYSHSRQSVEFEKKISNDNVVKLIEDLNKIADLRKRAWQRERKILYWLWENNAHTFTHKKYRSFQEFLKDNFPIETVRMYCKELVVARKEELLDIPIATYSVWDFRVLERFRAFVPTGITTLGGKKISKGNATYETKLNDRGIEQLKQCWRLAKRLAIADGIDSKQKIPHNYIKKAAFQIADMHEITTLKTLTLKEWRNRAIEAERKVKELEKKLLTLR